MFSWRGIKKNMCAGLVVLILSFVYSFSRLGHVIVEWGLNSIQPACNHCKANLGQKHRKKKILIWKSSKYLLF